MTAIIARLRDGGMGPRESERKQLLFDRAAEVLRTFGAPLDRSVKVWVPGRIEFLGKHTDYAGGRSLLCAIERGFCFVAAARSDDVVRIHDARSGETIVEKLHPASRGKPGHWGAYPLTVVHRLAANFPGPPALVGADVAFISDLPIAAGISSSSALVVGTYLVLAAVNALADRAAFREVIDSNESLAEYLGAVENGLTYRSLIGEYGVGTFGGSEDHTAMLCGVARSLVQYSFCPVRRERVVPLDPDLTFVIGTSGIVAEKTSGALAAYNRVASLARASLAGWNRATRSDDATLADALRSAGSVDALIFALESTTPPGEFSVGELTERVRQFAVESEHLVPAAAQAVAERRHDLLGAIVDQSMKRAVEMLHNQTPETIFLAESARELGAIASSAFGAGFGGSVWSLVRRDEAESFAERWEATYRSRYPALTSAEFFPTSAAPAATQSS